jgi:catechol 2,3-dioxygenase-like lactoylglutathione lyase family enzyme
MGVRRVVANIASDQMDAARAFYGEVLGMTIGMDHGWIMTFVGSGQAVPQISVATEGGSGMEEAPKHRHEAQCRAFVPLYDQEPLEALKAAYERLPFERRQVRKWSQAIRPARKLGLVGFLVVERAVIERPGQPRFRQADMVAASSFSRFA